MPTSQVGVGSGLARNEIQTRPELLLCMAGSYQIATPQCPLVLGAYQVSMIRASGLSRATLRCVGMTIFLLRILWSFRSPLGFLQNSSRISSPQRSWSFQSGPSYEQQPQRCCRSYRIVHCCALADRPGVIVGLKYQFGSYNERKFMIRGILSSSKPIWITQDLHTYGRRFGITSLLNMISHSSILNWESSWFK